MELLLLAPRRSELVASYFYYALAAGDVDKVLALSQRILAGLPNDPVAQWFYGLALIETPRTAPQGLRAMPTLLPRAMRLRTRRRCHGWRAVSRQCRQQYCCQRFITVVHIVSKMHGTVLVDPGRDVREMDRDRFS
ncbi:MAG: hypothetical protein ACI9W2_002097 [Gammaproteobacteria bacterium]